MPWRSWHTFGHTHATLSEQVGMSLSERQAQMGHAMTMHYTHADLNGRRAGIEQLSDGLVPQAG
jgi:integrase